MTMKEYFKKKSAEAEDRADFALSLVETEFRDAMETGVPSDAAVCLIRACAEVEQAYFQCPQIDGAECRKKVLGKRDKIRGILEEELKRVID